MDNINFDDAILFDELESAMGVTSTEDTDDNIEEETQIDENEIETDDPGTEDDQEPDDSTHEEDDEDEQDEDDTTAQVAKEQFEIWKQSGLLDVPEDFEFDGSVDKLEEAKELTVKNRYAQVFNAMMERMPAEFRDILTYASKGGSSVKDFLDTYMPAETVDLDLTSAENQKKVLREYYTRTNPNYTPERVDKLISSLEKAEALEESAQEAAVELQDLLVEQRQRLIEQQELDNQKAEERREQRTTELLNVIDSGNMELMRKNRLKAALLKPVDSDGRTMDATTKTISMIYQNPEHYVQLADILLDYKPDKGFDLDRLATKKVTKKVSNFRKMIKEIDPKTKMTGSSSRKKDLRIDKQLEDFLNAQ
jgi:hypothetical protein